MRRRLHERERHRIRLSFSSARTLSGDCLRLAEILLWIRSDPVWSVAVRSNPIRSWFCQRPPFTSLNSIFFPHFHTILFLWSPKLFHVPLIPKLFGFAGVIHWIVIYPVDSTIHPYNNRNPSTSSNLSTSSNSSISSNLSTSSKPRNPSSSSNPSDWSKLSRIWYTVQYMLPYIKYLVKLSYSFLENAWRRTWRRFHMHLEWMQGFGL